MSKVQVDTIVDKDDISAPSLTKGAIVTGVCTATSFDGAISEWVLGADGTSHYTFTGSGLTGAENDPTLYLKRGQKYRFKNSSGGHPFRIQSTANGSAGTAYNDGVTNNDAGNGTTLEWDVQFDAPSVLYYQCTAHGSMGGKIYIGNSGNSSTLVDLNVTGVTTTGIATVTTSVVVGSAVTANADGVITAGVGTFGSVVSGAISGTTGTFTGDANITGVTTTGIGTVTTSVVVGSAVTANSDGVITSGIVTAAGGLRCNDGASNGVIIGDGEDLIIQHNGTDSFIDNNTGDLYVQTTGSGDDVFVQPADALYLQSGGSNTRLLVNGVGSFTFDNGTFIEKCKITAGKLSDNQDIDLLDGMVHYFTTQESTTAVPNLRESASRTLGDAVNTGDIITVNIITTAAAAGYSAQLTIDGNAVTEEWIGGAAPSAGSSDGLDIYVYSCIRIGSGTGDSGWKVIANLTNATN